MVQQVSELQDVVSEQEKEIKELQTMKPRRLCKVIGAAQSAPPGGKIDTAPAVPAAVPPAQGASAPVEENSSASMPSDYVYQAKCEEDDSQSEYQWYKELAITEVADHLMACKKEMEANIIDQKARLKLGSKKMTDEQ